MPKFRRYKPSAQRFAVYKGFESYYSAINAPQLRAQPYKLNNRYDNLSYLINYNIKSAEKLRLMLYATHIYLISRTACGNKGDKLLKKVLIFSFVFILLLQTISASTFENYVGSTEWRVDVTEDETGCGGSMTTKSVALYIQHNKQIADVGNWEHGSAKGAFIGNKLSLPGRTIRDGVGNSKLSEFDLTFTNDCSSFSGKYGWDYADSYSRCSGYTSLRGTRIDGKGCPEEAEQTEELKTKKIADIRMEQDNAVKENDYNDILEKDPKNFWANWDMAELKKKEGKYDEFLKYLDKATSNEKIYKETREVLKKEGANSLHLSEFPTRDKSPILRIELEEVDKFDHVFVHELKVPKDENNEKWHFKIWRLLYPESYEVLNDAAGTIKN